MTRSTTQWYRPEKDKQFRSLRRERILEKEVRQKDTYEKRYEAKKKELNITFTILAKSHCTTPKNPQT